MFHSPREFAKVGRQYEKKGPQKNVDRTYPLEDTAGEKMIEPSIALKVVWYIFLRK